MRAQRSCSLVVAVLFAAGCASHGSGSVYSRSDAQRPWIVQEATILEINEAVIDGRESAIGTVGGGLIGHSVGRSVGHGAGSSIAGAVGAVAGAVIGQKAERSATQKKAWEILVDVEDGVEQLAIVQPADEGFSVGERVRIFTRSDGSARVAKL